MTSKQVNFRLSEEEYQILSLIAESSQLSIAEVSKKLILEKASPFREDLALQLFKSGKVGLKKAWKISGLSPSEFQKLMITHNIEPYYDEEIETKTMNIALSLDLKKHLKNIQM